MNDYEARQEARRQRLHSAAANAQAEADRRLDAAHQIGDMIPLGQPILVGHHSEGRHRRDIARIHTNMDKGVEAMKRAEELTHRANGVGTGGISSDDPDALSKLEEKLAAMQERQAHMTAVNKLVRRKDRSGLVTMGLSEQRITKLFTPDFCGRIGYAPFELTNNNANIKRVQGRIKELQAKPAKVAAFAEVQGNGWKLYLDDNRLCFAFETRQPQDVTTILKRHAFKWSPTRGAWVRQHTSNAEYAARQVCKVLT